MSSINYRKRGNCWHVYRVSNNWDKKLKKYKKTHIYLGVAKEKGGEYYKTTSVGKEKFIVDFGDGYTIIQIIEETGLLDIIQNIFLEKSNEIIVLICNKLINGSAINYAEDWLNGNVINCLLSNINISQQNIDNLLRTLGIMDYQKRFLELYIKKFFKDTSSILIDSTLLPSAIKFSSYNLGYNSKDIGCLVLADKYSKLPIFFKIIPKAIADVSTLKSTFSEIHSLGLNIDEAIFDAGYFSENNIAYLYEQNVDFIVRLPKSGQLFINLIDELTDIEQIINVVRHNKKIVFIESKKICLFNHEMFAHIILDPEKKAKDIMLFNEKLENYEEKTIIDKCMKYCGFVILISKKPIDKGDILPAYYNKQSIDQTFDFAKCNNTHPLELHLDESISGYLFLVFLSSIVSTSMRQSLQFHTSVDQALTILKNLKAKVYNSKIIPLEQNEKIKNLFKLLDIELPEFIKKNKF